jgi:hypothetical protein
VGLFAIIKGKFSMIVHKGTSTLLNFFAFDDLANFDAICNEVRFWERKLQSAAIVSRIPVYTFGKTDLLNITIADDSEAVNRVRVFDVAVRSQRLSELSAHYGTVLEVHPQAFDLNKAAQQYRIIGVVTAKIKDDAWRFIYRKFNTHKALGVKASELFKRAMTETANKQKTATMDSRAFLTLSYGAEDVHFVVFCNCFGFIKRFVTEFRRLSVDDFLGVGAKGLPLKHAVRSTETILGVYWPFNSIQNAINSSKKARTTVPVVLSSAISISTRPGHMQHAIDAVHSAVNKLPHRGAKTNGWFVRPVVGRNDVMVTRSRKYRNGSMNFFMEHLRLVQKLLTVRSIMKVETCLGFPNLKDAESNRIGRMEDNRQSIDSRRLQRIKGLIWNSQNLTQSERESFTAIVTKLGSLHSDKYVGEYLDTLTAAFAEGVTRYMDLTHKHKTTHGVVLDSWFTHIELCFASRHAGSPPVAETASPGFISRCASSQKYLKLLDYLAGCFMQSLEKKLSKRRFTLMHVIVNNQTGSGASCYRTPFVANAFVALPSTSIFYPAVSLFSFMHEMGHVVYDCLVSSLEYKNCFVEARDAYYAGRAYKRLQTSFDSAISGDGEAFAEFFAAHVLSGLDFGAHQERVRRIVKTHYGDGQPEEVYWTIKETHIRRAKQLFESKAPDPISGQMFSIFMRAVARWDDQLFVLIRKMIETEFTPETFWDLWIGVNNRLNANR